MCWMSFFFFQAEDGIRDVAVTGVQTCALPICKRHRRPRPAELFLERDDEDARSRSDPGGCEQGEEGDAGDDPAVVQTPPDDPLNAPHAPPISPGGDSAAARRSSRSGATEAHGGLPEITTAAAREFSPPQPTGGRRWAHGWASSNAAAARSTSASACQRPAIWRPTGRPSAVKPQGTFAAGYPVKLKGYMKGTRSRNGIGRPSASLGPALGPASTDQAVTGIWGVSSRS